MKPFYLLIFFLCLFYKSEAQGEGVWFSVKMNGYIFLSDDGLFFQPLYFGEKTPFLKALKKNSFRIEESNQIQFSQVIKGVGDRLLMKEYTDDSLKKNPSLRAYDTVYYFKCDITIDVNFEESRLTTVGYGFLVNDSLIYFGNTWLRNRLYEIIPEESRIVKQLYNSYKRLGWFVPEWFVDICKKRKLKV
jgi:hypothetical protein